MGRWSSLSFFLINIPSIRNTSWWDDPRDAYGEIGFHPSMTASKLSWLKFYLCQVFETSKTLGCHKALQRRSCWTRVAIDPPIRSIQLHGRRVQIPPPNSLETKVHVISMRSLACLFFLSWLDQNVNFPLAVKPIKQLICVWHGASLPWSGIAVLFASQMQFISSPWGRLP